MPDKTQKTLPSILHREALSHSRLFRAEGIELRFSNGEERYYEKLCSRHSGAVLIVPMLDENTVLFVREYAMGLENYHLGFPKGASEEGESLIEAANRELKEETGYGARELYFLKRVYLSPSYMEHSINIILARDLYPEKLEGDEPEPLDLVPVKIDQINEIVMQSDVSEGRSIAAFYMAKAWLENKLLLNEDQTR